MQPTIGNLSGAWDLDKSLSDNTEPLLKLQGIGWIMRKLLGSAAITITFTQATEGDVDSIDMGQKIVGLSSPSEKRYLDWREEKHSSPVFGEMRSQTKYIRGSAGSDGKVRPDFELETKVNDPKVAKFLRGEIDRTGEEVEGLLVDDPASDKYGEGKGLWVYGVAHEGKDAWKAEQIWGFETINGQRCFTRRVVASTKKEYQLCRIVYTPANKA